MFPNVFFVNRNIAGDQRRRGDYPSDGGPTFRTLRQGASADFLPALETIQAIAAAILSRRAIDIGWHGCIITRLEALPK